MPACLPQTMTVIGLSRDITFEVGNASCNANKVSFAISSPIHFGIIITFANSIKMS